MKKVFVLMALIGSVYGAKVSIISSKIGALIYVDGIKKSVIKETPNAINIANGKHTIKVVEKIDENWAEVEEQTLSITDQTTSLTFEAFHIKRLQKKN